MKIAITLITCCRFKVHPEHQLLWWLIESISDGKNGVIHQSIYSNHLSVWHFTFVFMSLETWIGMARSQFIETQKYIKISPIKRSLFSTRISKKVRSKFGGLTSHEMISPMLTSFERILRGVSHIKLRSMKATSLTYKLITCCYYTTNQQSFFTL